jgi:hypothetical protein
MLMRDHCGVDITAEHAADRAVTSTERQNRKSRPVICNTMKIDGDLSSTVCN